MHARKLHDGLSRICERPIPEGDCSSSTLQPGLLPLRAAQRLRSCTLQRGVQAVQGRAGGINQKSRTRILEENPQVTIYGKTHSRPAVIPQLWLHPKLIKKFFD